MKCIRGLVRTTLLEGVFAAGVAWLCCAAALGQEPAKSETPCAIRELYAPAHFGNSYEVMNVAEMRTVLEEAKQWGFNRYGDWFDMEDCADPFVDQKNWNLSLVLWERKKAHYLMAQSLGMTTDLIITPNHVYLDQCLPELRAQKGERMFGQLICPSKPEARALILKDYENLFADLAKAGVHLTSLSAGPYDYGGCGCDACKPWILTFAKLMKEIHAVAQKYHPRIEMNFIGWWWSAEEHKQFAEWADAEAPGWAKSIYLHIPYGEWDVSNVPLPKGCDRRAFVHIGYGEEARPEDTYCHLGPVIAADRIEKTVAALAAHGCTGWMAYSEGVYDDASKALLAEIASGGYRNADEVLIAYAKRYLNADDSNAQAWANWLKQWGKPYVVDTEKAAAELTNLRQTAPAASWRFRQWECKVELMRASAAIMAANEWTPERLAQADTFWSTQAAMQREVYGLGPLRHIFGRQFSPMPWYNSWAEHEAKQASALQKEM